MTEPVQIAVVVAAQTVIIAGLNYLQQRGVKKDMATVKAQTNHIKDALIETTKTASHAKGVQDEKVRSAIESNVPVNSVVAGPPITDYEKAKE